MESTDSRDNLSISKAYRTQNPLSRHTTQENKTNMPTHQSDLMNDILLKLQDMEGRVTELHDLENEASMLKRKIKTENERLSLITAMLKETSKVVKIASSAAEAFDGKKKNAENTWLYYWGVIDEFEAVVFEMESLASWAV